MSWYRRLPKLTKLRIRLEDRAHGDVEWEATQPPPKDLGRHGRRPDRIVFIAKSRSVEGVRFPDIEVEGTWLAIGENPVALTDGPPATDIDSGLLFISSPDYARGADFGGDTGATVWYKRSVHNVLATTETPA